jgi:hypothetical protein
MNSRTSRPRSDESDHVDRGARRARDHAEQRGLADARAREDAEPLAEPAGHETVERAHAEPDALANARPGERARGHRDRRARERARHRLPVLGNAQPVEDPPEQAVADGDAKRRAAGQHARAGTDPVQLAERHQKRAPVPEADDLGRHRGAVAIGADEADLADLGLQAGGLDDQADQVADEAVTPR